MHAQLQRKGGRSLEIEQHNVQCRERKIFVRISMNIDVCDQLNLLALPRHVQSIMLDTGYSAIWFFWQVLTGFQLCPACSTKAMTNVSNAMLRAALMPEQNRAWHVVTRRGRQHSWRCMGIYHVKTNQAQSSRSFRLTTPLLHFAEYLQDGTSVQAFAFHRWLVNLKLNVQQALHCQLLHPIF